MDEASDLRARGQSRRQTARRRPADTTHPFTRRLLRRRDAVRPRVKSGMVSLVRARVGVASHAICCLVGAFVTTRRTRRSLCALAVYYYASLVYYVSHRPSLPVLAPLRGCERRAVPSRNQPLRVRSQRRFRRKGDGNTCAVVAFITRGRPRMPPAARGSRKMAEKSVN